MDGVFKGKLLNLLERLQSCGVVIQYPYWINNNDESIGIENIDFSEHDKTFQDEINKLQTDISNIKLRCAVEVVNDFKQGNYDILKVVRTADYEELKKINDELAEENKQLHRELQEAAFTDNLPYDPISVAEFLINKTGKYEHNSFMKTFTGNEHGTYNIYGISELRQIAEHLLVYCNNNKDEG